MPGRCCRLATTSNVKTVSPAQHTCKTAIRGARKRPPECETQSSADIEISPEVAISKWWGGRQGRLDTFVFNSYVGCANF